MSKNENESNEKDLSKILEPYSDEWVALSKDEERVVGHGKNITQAISQAHQKGEKNPIITKVPEEYSSYVL